MVGRGDGDGVDRFVLQQLAQIGVGGGRLAALRFDESAGLAEDGVVDVAEGHQIHFRQRGEGLHMALAAAAQPDGGDANCVVGTGHRAQC